MRRRRFVSLLLFTLIFICGASPTYRALVSLPAGITLPVGHHLHLGHLPGLAVDAGGRGPSLQPSRIGTYRVRLRLFGGPVVKEIHVKAVPPQKVILGGQSIGIVMHLGGTVVVGFSDLPGKGGPNPAKAAGLVVGDRIVAADRMRVHKDSDLLQAINRAGRQRRPVSIALVRGGQSLERGLRPVYDAETGLYRLGIYVKDDITGVGTLTFVRPHDRAWAALGHPVADRMTRVPVGPGHIVPAAVVGVTPGRRGTPGEKLGLLTEGHDSLGPVKKNTPVGIMGTFDHAPSGKEIPVATAAEVREGPATLYTVIHGQEVQGFSVVIERKLHVSNLSPKAFILRVTDPKLLASTGGIVQGMSGSPLVQGGRLIGAVTHVFINDPSRGFGVYAEWMLDAMDRR